MRYPHSRGLYVPSAPRGLANSSSLYAPGLGSGASGGGGAQEGKALAPSAAAGPAQPKKKVQWLGPVRCGRPRARLKKNWVGLQPAVAQPPMTVRAPVTRNGMMMTYKYEQRRGGGTGNTSEELKGHNL